MKAVTGAGQAARIFKTRWFAKAARKARIEDDELCDAAVEIMRGQADDLGGGVFKKRLNRNMHRGIILARGRACWVYAYLFAKQDRANIDDDELSAFRDLADVYAAKSGRDLDREVAARELVEICRERKIQIQERRLRGDP